MSTSIYSKVHEEFTDMPLGVAPVMQNLQGSYSQWPQITVSMATTAVHVATL